MREGNRRVLTIEEPSAIRNVLNVLSEAFDPESTSPPRICERLKWFAKEGCEALILNLRVLEEPLVGTFPKVRHVGASLVGGVLVVSCQVTAPWIVQIEELCRGRFFLKDLISSLSQFVRAAF